MDEMTSKIEQAEQTPPNVHLWSRNGFLGTNAVGLQAGYTPDFVSAEGLHAPRRIAIERIETADLANPDALATPLMVSRNQQLTISLSRRREAMPFTLRNVEADELHFIQRGRVRFDTEFGSLDAC